MAKKKTSMSAERRDAANPINTTCVLCGAPTHGTGVLCGRCVTSAAGIH